MKPRLLDLFCGAGGAGKGYADAGFEVIGVDIRPQPRYPFEFHQADAMDILGFLACSRAGVPPSWLLSHGFDAIHASPPCQANSSLRRLNPDRQYLDLIPETRDALQRLGLPYVIENVIGAELVDPIMLCGSSFALGVRRHRLFEVNFPVMLMPCAHAQQMPRYPVGLGSPSRTSQDRSPVSYVYGSTRYPGDLADRKEAMGIDWMTNGELTQAIPPAYTEHIGRYLLAEVDARAKVAA